MPLGPEPLTFPESKGSYLQRLKLAFNHLDKTKPAVIIIDHNNMGPEPVECQEAQHNTSYHKLTSAIK